jgi:hypothetical protein
MTAWSNSQLPKKKSSNSKFKTSLGHFSHWTTIKGDNLTRRLDVSAYKNFEFGIAGRKGKRFTIDRLLSTISVLGRIAQLVRALR